MTTPVVLGTLLLAVFPLITGAAERDDSDGDGILDDHGAVLGTDPRKPELFTRIRRLEFRLPVGKQAEPWQVLLAGGGQIALDPAGSVRQQTDARLLVALNRREQAEEARLAGSLRPGGSRGCAVAVRDAWQNSPKGFSFSGDGLNVELWQRAAIETIAPDDEPPATAETGQGWVSIRLPRLVHYASVKIAPSGPAPAR
jgi:hypothetical protein